jgi:N-acetyltransferase 10
MKQIRKMAQRGLLDPDNEDPFALFVASTNIRYCYYADTHKILGNTFGMCVLQVCLSSPAKIASNLDFSFV